MRVQCLHLFHRVNKRRYPQVDGIEIWSSFMHLNPRREVRMLLDAVILYVSIVMHGQRQSNQKQNSLADRGRSSETEIRDSVYGYYNTE